MEQEGAAVRDEIRLPFEPGDRFIQVHANGVILVVADDYQWNLASLGQAVAVALEAKERGTRILLGHEVLDERSTAALESVRRIGATVVDFGTVIPPMTWPSGTTPLMTAVTVERNDLVEDLLARGVPAGTTDDSGATALHHAAHAGNAAGCELLIGAGVDPATPDRQGRTAADLARLGGHHQLAVTLDPAGAGRLVHVAAEGADADFGWWGPAKLIALWVGVICIPVVFVPIALEWASVWSVAPIGFTAAVLWTQGHLFRAGGPRRLRDSTLELIGITGTVRLPLDDLRGVILIPARAVNGSPVKLVLCQDRLGRSSTAKRIHALSPGRVPLEEAERFAALAERHLVVVLGRGRLTERILKALAPDLDRPDVVANAYWQELARIWS
jgi:membrane protein implicated in regulation of membrane protease activity